MKIINLRKEYHNKHNTVLALDNVNLDFDDQGLTIILGSSGSGKTTLLNIIAQVDNDYQGMINDPLTVSYLTQNIELFENLSVEDNIKLVCNDSQKVNDYLQQFNLTDIKNKKIKKCSQGQKRRVQVLGAYFNDKQMLVLDEPTSALDHDNAVNIMKMLKAIAREKLVIMITHDIALAHEYADRLIEIDKGSITKDMMLEHQEVIEKQPKAIVKPSLKNNLIFALKDLISRPFKFVLNIFLTTICLLAIYMMINVLSSVNKEADYLETVASGDSIVVTYNDNMISKQELRDGYHLFKSGLRDDYFPKLYIEYDNIPYDRLVDTLEKVDGIAAVEANTDHDLYYVDSDRLYQEVLGKDQKIYKCMPTLVDEGDRTSIGYPFKPLTSPFISNIVLPSANEYNENKDFMKMFDAHKEVALNGLNFFHVVDDSWDIPLLYGEPMSEANDIIIDMQTAKLWQQLKGIEEIEDLIGTEIELKVCTWASIWLLEDDSREAVAAENYDFFDSYDYTIKGITSLNNDDMRIALVQEGILEDQILASTVIASEGLDFKDVKFILEPNVNYEQTCAKINESLGLTKTSFVQKSKVTSDNVALKRNNEALIAYVGAVIVVLFATFFLNLIMNKKVFLKEQKLLKEYGYHNNLIEIAKLLIVIIISVGISLMVKDAISLKINEWARTFGYSLIISDHFVYFGIAIIMVMILEMILTMSVKLFKR
ncbi:MAG: ABC transporter ATP-binding protein [Erysipelotrichaceae bacterium]|nr:ABC transporter ATP-binding protein [Erysipelotrichaceae bacterium]MDY5251135.1 ABC transporter ATP-binding protein [Erysipelotrichaceae bacterium]